jgi:hypothetical protein
MGVPLEPLVMTLSGTLSATVEDGVVAFSFVVENTGDEPVGMQFADAQEFEVTVERDGQPVWRYGEGRMFAQMLSSAELAPGERSEYETEWTDPDDGEFLATAELVATDAECTAETEFSV